MAKDYNSYTFKNKAVDNIQSRSNTANDPDDKKKTKKNISGDRQMDVKTRKVTPTGKTYEVSKNRDATRTTRQAMTDSKTGKTTTSTLYNKDRTRKEVRTYKDGKVVSRKIIPLKK